MKILVTGASGFVGRAMVSRLQRDTAWSVRAASRQPRTTPMDSITIERIDARTDWLPALQGVDAVVHLANRAHVLRDVSSDSLADYRRVNVDGTVRLAEQAAAVGIRRFVFVSSVKVNGEQGSFVESDPPAPRDAYGVSKLEAERALQDLSGRSGLGVVVVRPPLVYGPGVKANFAALVKVVSRGIPLPLGAIRNRRSLVALDNLVDFLCACLGSPAAHGETFFVSDGHDLSTPDIVRHIAAALDRPARLLSVPPALIASGAALVGRRGAASRLLGSLQVDISKARRVLSWAPPVSVADAFRRAVGRA
jgi:nucleoside-diphosphate-sugar epimerase